MVTGSGYDDPDRACRGRRLGAAPTPGEVGRCAGDARGRGRHDRGDHWAHDTGRPRETQATLLVVQVDGLPKGTTAKVHVKGPKLSSTSPCRPERTRRSRTLGPASTAPRSSRSPGYTAKVTRVRQGVTAKRAQIQDPLRVVTTADRPRGPHGAPQPWTNLPGPKSITAVSTSAAGMFGNRLSDFPAWSPDGGRIAFSSCATNPVPSTTAATSTSRPSPTDPSPDSQRRLGDEYALTNGWAGETQWHAWGTESRSPPWRS